MLINSRVKDMPEMFGLEVGVKEIFPYKYYNYDLYIDEIGNIKNSYKIAKIEEPYDDYVNAIKRSGAYIDEDRFNMEVYALFYCEQDVRILSDSLLKFRE